MNKVLIVEDEIAISDLIKIELELQGYRCDVANDGEIAANYIEKNDYDLILLDIMLPKINGYELLEYIKQVSQTPTIFITAKSQTKDKIKYLLVEENQYNLTRAILQPRLIWLKESFNQKRNFKILVEKLVEKDDKF